MPSINPIKFTLLVLLNWVLWTGSAASAADCGDPANRRGQRTPCACGDTVTTDTRLRGSDPVVKGRCNGTALSIGAHDIELDCNGHTLSGTRNPASVGVLILERIGVTVSSCNIVGFGTAILIEGGEGNRATGNRIRNTVGFAISAPESSFDTRVDDNFIWNSGGGIWMAFGEFNEISDNRIDGSDVGIWMSGEDSLVMDNDVNEGDIQIDGENHRVIGNRVDDGRVLVSGDGHEIRENGVAGGGIHVAGAGHAVEENDVRDAQAALEITGEDHLIANNVLEKSDRGLVMGNTTDSEAVENQISKNRVGILLVDSSDNEASDNFLDANQVGILLVDDALRNQISRNLLRRNHTGVLLQEETSANRVSENMLVRNGTGIRLEQSARDNFVVENHVTKSRRSGIEMDASTEGNSVTDNRLAKNGRYGIEDASEGPSTAGTANSYAGNRCNKNRLGASSPAGLCEGD